MSRLRERLLACVKHGGDFIDRIEASTLLTEVDMLEYRVRQKRACDLRIGFSNYRCTRALGHTGICAYIPERP